MKLIRVSEKFHQMGFFALIISDIVKEGKFLSFFHFFLSLAFSEQKCSNNLPCIHYLLLRLFRFVPEVAVALFCVVGALTVP